MLMLCFNVDVANEFMIQSNSKEGLISVFMENYIWQAIISGV